METKVCTKCKENKNISDFYFVKSRNCYNWHCKKCVYSARPSQAKKFSPTIFLDLEGEVWLPIPNTNNVYEASNLSRIKSVDRHVINEQGIKRYVKGRILKQHLAKHAYNRYYYNVCICIKNKKKTTTVHSLVFYAFNGFYPKRNSGMVVDHKDNNSLNNNLENLELITHRENSTKDRKGSSKYSGVYFIKNRKAWQSAISINKKQIKILFTKDELKAKKSYEIALENIHLYNGNNAEFRKLIKEKMAIVE